MSQKSIAKIFRKKILMIQNVVLKVQCVDFDGI